MKVTVVVRTFNRPAFLKECLASVACQTHTDWEVLLFDDGAGIANFEIYKKFKEQHSDNRIVYITSDTPYEMFQQSWLYSPELATGDIMVRLDDDDLLTKDALKYISDLYERNPELDFSYGSAFGFEDGKLIEVINTQSPAEVPPTRNMWVGYTIPNNHPWRNPYCWWQDYYEKPRLYTSIIHCSKTNIMCVFHLYTMRTKSVKVVKDKITVTSKYADDLEFFGSLDYLGLAHTAIHKVLTYFRKHDYGRVTDIVCDSEGLTIVDAVTAIRDKVDYLRPAGFQSRIIPIDMNDNLNDGVTTEASAKFDEYYSEIKSKSLRY